MKKSLKHIFRIIFGRSMIYILMLLLQIAYLFVVFEKLGLYSGYIYALFSVLSSILLVYIINRKGSPEFKLVWVIPVLILPIFGALIYMWSRLQPGTNIIRRRHIDICDRTAKLIAQNKGVMDELEEQDPLTATLAKYMSNYGGYPIYKNTKVTYFPLGEDKLAELLIQLEKAEKFIFMEYFIVEDGEMWQAVLDVLKRKAAEGVEVRVMYDGMCSVVLLPYGYPKELAKYGIKSKMFAPIRPVLSTSQNNRDHRKIVSIDGKVAFTGGINLADEYINRKLLYGHWKDTAVMLEGDAAESFTMMFLQMWNVDERTEDDYSKYLVPSVPVDGADGYVMPYGDSPLDGENVGEMVYLDIINTAKRYVHIMTPYLILDGEMLTALTHAAMRGVDVKLILPHIPDKKYAYLLARSHYKELIQAGVKIFEYEPGFVHAKVFVSDDDRAVVGSINLDYRSLYLHFECAAFMFRCSEIARIERDFLNTLKKCIAIDMDNVRKYPAGKKALGSLLRLIAPLM
ncbi:MAG: cardiolipin synthase [Oscillospiraceae bacterium]|nr:cardiolipin synthase [Oscillospiraceae bacterium]